MIFLTININSFLDKPTYIGKDIKDLKENEVTFPGLPPLYVNFAMKKEERSLMTQKDRVSFPFSESAKFMVSCFDPDIVKINS